MARRIPVGRERFAGVRSCAARALANLAGAHLRRFGCQEGHSLDSGYAAYSGNLSLPAKADRLSRTSAHGRDQRSDQGQGL